MRLKLTLKVVDSQKISLNYHYSLSSAIYSLLRIGSPEFSDFLHNSGFNIKSNSYKLFTFALVFEKNDPTISDGCMFFNSSFANLYISSPLNEEFIMNVLVGSLERQILVIYADFVRTRFSVIRAEFVPPPVFSDLMYFRMMTSLVVSSQRKHNGKTSQYYFRYNDNMGEIQRVFENNLINKYEVITSNAYTGKGVSLEWDAEYIKSAIEKNKRLSKKVSVYKDVNNPIDIIGIFCPFFIRGDSELIKIGYECGFGEKNSMGFGMVKFS